MIYCSRHGYYAFSIKLWRTARINNTTCTNFDNYKFHLLKFLIYNICYEAPKCIEHLFEIEIVILIYNNNTGIILQV